MQQNLHCVVSAIKLQPSNLPTNTRHPSIDVATTTLPQLTVTYL